MPDFDLDAAFREPKPAEFEQVAFFPSGYSRQAQEFMGWLRFYRLTPSRSDAAPGEEGWPGDIILLPASDVRTFRRLQKSYPERFGRPRA